MCVYIIIGYFSTATQNNKRFYCYQKKKKEEAKKNVRSQMKGSSLILTTATQSTTIHTGRGLITRCRGAWRKALSDF